MERLSINLSFNWGGGDFISQKCKEHGFAMLDLLISFGILILSCCLLLPSYVASITQKNDYRMEEAAFDRLFDNLKDYQISGRPLFIGKAEIKKESFTFYLEGDVYFATYTDSKNKVQKVYEKLP